jgi:hypothetical protein
MLFSQRPFKIKHLSDRKIPYFSDSYGIIPAGFVIDLQGTAIFLRAVPP